jgi:mannosyltransferase OCH1-like enzyme
MIIQSMWLGQNITRMERACIQSWINKGYDYHLFTYDKINNLPEGVTIRDGREIISEKTIFKYNLPSERGGGSFSGFSNFFRYKLLLNGGIWVDSDMYCIKLIPDFEYIFVRERCDYVASCILKVPPDSKFAQYCWDICCKKDVTQITWGETGPALVTEAINHLNLHEYIQDTEFYFPISCWDVYKFLENHPIPNSYTVHFWNEMWRREGQDKNAFYESGTLYEKLINSNTRIF